MRKVFVALAAFALFMSLLVGLSIFAASRIDQTPPILGFGKVETKNSPIHAGENLSVRIWREKARDDCPVKSFREAVSEDGKGFDLPDGEWKGGAADSSYLDYDYPTMEEMPKGNYELRVKLFYTCPGGLTFEYDQPSARFRVQ